MGNKYRKKYKIFLFVFVAISTLFFVNRGIVAAGPHTDSATYAPYLPDLADDVCKACHLPHSGKGVSRLWVVATKGGDTAYVDTTGATLIQNLCVYCHWEYNLEDSQDNNFKVGRYDAHTLTRAHGQNYLSYAETDSTSSDTTKRFGPGHLYRRSYGDGVRTRDGDIITGYGTLYSYDQYGFDTMAISADSSSGSTIIQDFSLLSRLSCFSCHEPHANFLGTTAYINREGSISTYDSSQANNYIKFFVGDDTSSTLNPTYYDSVVMSPGLFYIGRTRKVCLGCHFGGEEPPASGSYTLPANPTMIDGIMPPVPPGRTQVVGGKKNVGAHYDGRTKCVLCHGWDRPPPNCTECHGYPPAGATGSPPLDKHYPNDYNPPSKPAFTIVGIGAHETHVIGQGYDCVVCHREYLGPLHNNETVNVLFDTAYVITETTAVSTTYVTVEVRFPGGTRLDTTDTCEVTGTGESKIIRCQVACHNPIPGGATFNKWVNWPTLPVGERGNPPTDTDFAYESVYNVLACVNCHDAMWDSSGGGYFGDVSHHPYASDSIESQRNSCTICHVDHKWMEYTGIWESKDDPYPVYSDNKRHETHASLRPVSAVGAKTGDTTGTASVFEWNLMVFNSTSAPGFPNPSLALDSVTTRNTFGFPTRFGTGGIFAIYNENDTTVGLCDPCHDATPFEIRNGNQTVHDSDSTYKNLGSTYSYRAPMAARFFYQETTFYETTGSGGHGWSSTQVSNNKMGDSRLPGVDDGYRIKCRSCHFYHGSPIQKILDTAAMRAKDLDTFTLGNYNPYTSPLVATGNNNSFCFRCHFYNYDNGFYYATTFQLSIHGDTSTSSNAKIWSDSTSYYVPYVTAGTGHPKSYFWQPDETTGAYENGLCVYCHEPHGGYGWDSSVFDTWGFSSFTRAGTRSKYVDDSTYGTSVNLGDQTLCFKCHSADSTWNVYLDTVWSSAVYASKVYNVDDWIAKGDTTALDMSTLFTTDLTISKSHHRVNKSEQVPGALGNSGYLIIECINCHNPHTVRKDSTHDSTAENLMYPFRPAEFIYDTAVTDSTQEFRLYNKFCLACHNANSETSGVYDTSNEQRGNIYKYTTDLLWGKLPRGISFSSKTMWGEGNTTSQYDTGKFHSWNKETYYNSTGHGMDSTLSIGADYESDRLPLSFLGTYGMSCGRVTEFACHDPHGSPDNISLLRADNAHPYGDNNDYTTHIYDSTSNAGDDARNVDRWCAAACHRLGIRPGENNWSHVYNYVRANEALTGAGAGDYDSGADTIKDIDIYDSAGPNEPSYDNLFDMNHGSGLYSHTSFNRVPGDGNTWPDESGWGYQTVTYKQYLPVKQDSDGPIGNRFVCFTCHDPHGTPHQGMTRYEPDTTGGGLCTKCHIPR